MKRKLTILLIALAILGSVFFVFMTYKPNSNQAALPAWIAQVEPFRSNHMNVVRRVGATVAGTSETTVDTEARRLSMGFPELAKKLDRDLGKEAGWTKGYTAQGVVTWTCTTPVGRRSLMARAMGTGSEVHSSWQRQPTWLEKTQQSIRRFFGAK